MTAEADVRIRISDRHTAVIDELRESSFVRNYADLIRLAAAIGYKHPSEVPKGQPKTDVRWSVLERNHNFHEFAMAIAIASSPSILENAITKSILCNQIEKLTIQGLEHLLQIKKHSKLALAEIVRRLVLENLSLATPDFEDDLFRPVGEEIESSNGEQGE
jgi:hypothetical protein